MSIETEIKSILADVLQLGSSINKLESDSPLLGSIPEFDSMAVVGVITALEESYGFEVDDDEIDAEVFETLGSLVNFVEKKQEE